MPETETSGRRASPCPFAKMRVLRRRNPFDSHSTRTPLAYSTRRMNFPRQLQLLVTSSKASTSRSYSVASKARKVRTPPHQPTAPRTPSTTTTAPLSAIPPLPASPSTPLASSDAFKTSSASPFSSDKGKARDDTPWYDLSKKPWEEPPLVAAARGKSVKQRSVWESYLGPSRFSCSSFPRR